MFRRIKKLKNKIRKQFYSLKIIFFIQIKLEIFFLLQFKIINYICIVNQF
jgi:hypothetical protein